MDNLPDEILIEIFSYFDIKSFTTTHIRVCKRWYKLIMNTSCLSTRFLLEDKKDLIFLKNWPNSSFIKTLDIRMQVDLINSLFEELEAVCPHISSLTMCKGNALSERHIYRLNKCFPRLTHIDVFLTSHFISQHFLDILTGMKSIVLNNQIDESTLRAIGNNCHSLKELHMYGYVQFYPMFQLHNLLTVRYNQLTNLTLRCYEVTDRTCEIISHCTNLQHLRLYHCWLITDSGLMCLKSLVNLRTLHLTGLKLVTKNGLGQFIEACDLKSLTELNVSSSAFNDAHALAISKKLENLRILEMWYCRQLTSVGINHLVMACKRLFIMDLNMELSDKVLNNIIFHSDIKYVTFDHDYQTKLNMTFPEDRNVQIRPAFRCYNELYFRGNSEGFRGNVLCYSHQNDLQYMNNSNDF